MEIEILQHEKSFPGFTGEAYPELFDINAMPLQPEILKPGQIPENLVKQYFEKGYVALDNFFTPEELDPCRDAIDDLVDDLANRLYKAGKITNPYKEYGLFDRLTKVEHEFPGAVVILHKLSRLPEAFRKLWANERLLNLVEQLIGPDISGSPNWNLRTKVPNTPSMDVPWHQDSAYLDSDTYKVLMPTVWVPFLDTNKINGCMEMVEGGHRKGMVATHKCCVGDTWYIKVEEEEMERTLGVNVEESAAVCPIPYGGLLLFNNLIPHRSLPNYSDSIRWSVDLRFLRSDQPDGLFGLKKAVALRSSKNPNMTIDWDSFDAVDRSLVQQLSVKDIVKVHIFLTLRAVLVPLSVTSKDVKIDDVTTRFSRWGMKTQESQIMHERQICDSPLSSYPCEIQVTAESDEFDITNQGPWMKKWEIVNHNSHVLAYQTLEKSKRKNLTF